MFSRRWLLAGVLAASCAAAPLFAQSFGLPQIVAGKFDKDNLSTTITISNDAQVACGFEM